MAKRFGNEGPAVQSEWSEDQLRCLVCELLESPDGRDSLVRVLMSLLLSDERVREAVARAAIEARAQVVPLRTIGDIVHDLEIEEAEYGNTYHASL